MLAIKELLLSPIKDDRAFLQRLMCDHGVENVLFAAKYLTVTKGTNHFAQALLASEGIVDVKGLNINGEDVKALGYKSYLIKQALRDALDAVITNRCENTHDALCAYLRSRLKP